MTRWASALLQMEAVGWTVVLISSLAAAPTLWRLLRDTRPVRSLALPLLVGLVVIGAAAFDRWNRAALLENQPSSRVLALVQIAPSLPVKSRVGGGHLQSAFAFRSAGRWIVEEGGTACPLALPTNPYRVAIAVAPETPVRVLTDTAWDTGPATLRLVVALDAPEGRPDHPAAAALAFAELELVVWMPDVSNDPRGGQDAGWLYGCDWDPPVVACASGLTPQEPVARFWEARAKLQEYTGCMPRGRRSEQPDARFSSVPSAVQALLDEEVEPLVVDLRTQRLDPLALAERGGRALVLVPDPGMTVQQLVDLCNGRSPRCVITAGLPVPPRP